MTVAAPALASLRRPVSVGGWTDLANCGSAICGPAVLVVSPLSTGVTSFTPSTPAASLSRTTPWRGALALCRGLFNSLRLGRLPGWRLFGSRCWGVCAPTCRAWLRAHAGAGDLHHTPYTGAVAGSCWPVPTPGAQPFYMLHGARRAVQHLQLHGLASSSRSTRFPTSHLYSAALELCPGDGDAPTFWGGTCDHARFTLRSPCGDPGGLIICSRSHCPVRLSPMIAIPARFTCATHSSSSSAIRAASRWPGLCHAVLAASP